MASLATAARDPVPTGVSIPAFPEPPAWSSSSGDTPFDDFLAAIRHKDAAATSKAFLAWTDALGDEFSPRHHEALTQLTTLSGPVLSEVLRSMDPVLQPKLDVAHALNITQGDTKFTDAGKLMDEFGVRHHHRNVITGVQTILERCEESRIRLSVADFETILRMVGASVDYPLSSIVFSTMSKHGLVESRTTKSWIEFLKARFMLDPVYYQYDRARMLVSPRARVTNDETCGDNSQAILEMDRIRFSMNDFKRQPWNRRRDDPTTDIRRQLRRKGEDFRSFWHHWVRTQLFEVDLDVELLSVSIEGFSRSGDREAILEHILQGYYGIEVNEESQSVSGGFDIPRDSPLYPTSRLQFAISEAFGAMGDISLGMQLVDFISQRYDVPISPATWSNLLNWTYVSSSKELHAMRKAAGMENDGVTSSDVLHVWEVMTSPPYSIEPSFEDLDVYMKALLFTRNLNKALDVVREIALPYHQSITAELEEALMDEILLNDAAQEHPGNSPSTFTSSTLSTARRRRQQAEIHKDLVSNRIASWFDRILRQASSSRLHRRSSFASATIPDLVRDYPDFFPQGVRYRTATGEVRIRGVDDSPRFQPVQTVARDALKQKVSYARVIRMSVDENGEHHKIVDPETGKKIRNPEYVWPTNKDKTIVEKRRMPYVRDADLGTPPRRDAKRAGAEAEKKYWANLTRQLMM